MNRALTMPAIPSSDLPMCLRRDMYLDAVSKAYRPTLEILIESVTKANPDLARYVHFPFWSIDDTNALINWYIRYDPPKHHVWHHFKAHLEVIDDIVAINFDGSNAIVMSQYTKNLDRTVHRKHFNLADPNSFQELGKYILKLLV